MGQERRGFVEKGQDCPGRGVERLGGSLSVRPAQGHQLFKREERRCVQVVRRRLSVYRGDVTMPPMPSMYDGMRWGRKLGH